MLTSTPILICNPGRLTRAAPAGPRARGDQLGVAGGPGGPEGGPGGGGRFARRDRCLAAGSFQFRKFSEILKI